MTSKTTKIFLFASLAVLLLIPLSSVMVDAFTPFELPNEIKQKIKKNYSPHVQSTVQDILKLGLEKERATSNVQIQKIEEKIEEKVQEMKTIREQNKKVYKDHDKLLDVEKSLGDIEGLPLVMSLVGENKLTVILSPESEDPRWKQKIEAIINDDTLDVQIGYGTFEYTDFSHDCTYRADNCEPLQGGIQIKNQDSDRCTLGLPVKQGTTTGYLTAGHCYDVNDSIYQPYKSTTYYKIGTVNSGDKIDDGVNCDCLFITDTNSRTNESQVWLSSGISASITGSKTVSVGDELDISGTETGNFDETVQYIITDSNGLKIILMTADSGAKGDSGAPVYDWGNHDIVGIYTGQGTATIDGVTSTYSVVIPWASISDSTNGLGVSLL